MSRIINEISESSRGAHFVSLFKVDADQFQLWPQKSCRERGCEFLNRPYDLSDLMRQATAAGVWPR